MSTPVIESERISLMSTTEPDLDFVTVLESHPDNRHYIMTYTREQHLGVIADSNEQHLIIIDKGTNEKAGFVILGGLNNPHHSLELRRIIVDKKGKGLGTETLQLIKKYCFEILQMHRLWLDVVEDNQKAIYIYASAGFKSEGLLREAAIFDREYKSLKLMSILKNEYLAE
ncbi:GNAT family N-acetyltransferase [Fulvivirga sp. 29W222]|uniref:GNAT family N-acetyltransferase n=1 Tax=Fulvivirga marina TaxID=2494733 RepID=A0A937FXL2_9BACT|nr:GNAT family protein [Fulvivirga marina]MBL6446607.1 GNAT family N-acetyltransferase [Fulvivirga marina]